ncbi:MAG TPA: group III truncated hemoglobin [Cyclobacteriaceae bacterium]
MGNDIASRKDIESLVGKFYEKVQADPLLAPHFSHVDWEKHLPVMYRFWSSMMLGEQSYSGNPFQKHVNLPIDEKHFTAWLKLFTETVDENFSGERADEIKLRAQSIAGVFQHKINLVRQAP